jgi:ribA/ribD-fused uncharacterized protein
MSPHRVTWDGREWRTTEALFQARRFAPDDPIVELIRTQTSPMSAKMKSKTAANRRVIEPLSAEDVELMREVVSLKLAQHPQLAEELAATKGRTIIEDCSSRPRGSGLFWGAARRDDGTWKGSNVLGLIWMQHRDGVSRR